MELCDSDLTFTPQCHKSIFLILKILIGQDWTTLIIPMTTSNFIQCNKLMVFAEIKKDFIILLSCLVFLLGILSKAMV